MGGPAWTRVADGQWYLHLFDEGQPDVNWDHPEVADEFDAVMRFWLDRGAAGFRIDVAHSLTKDPGYPDAGSTSTRARARSMRAVLGPRRSPPDRTAVATVLDEYEDRMMVAEAWVAAERRPLYLRPDEYHQAFDFDLLAAPWDARQFAAIIDESLSGASAVGSNSTWVLSNHDVVRHATRYGLPTEVDPERWLLDGPHEVLDADRGATRARAAALLTLALPGSVYVYQGDELGLPEAWQLPVEVLQDPIWHDSGHTVKGRDGCRVPIPWEPSGLAGLRRRRAMAPATIRVRAPGRRRAGGGSLLDAAPLSTGSGYPEASACSAPAASTATSPGSTSASTSSHSDRADGFAASSTWVTPLSCRPTARCCWPRSDQRRPLPPDTPSGSPDEAEGMEIVTKQGHPDFLDLPWEQPLAEWTDSRLVKMAHGISRHIVRFVRFGDRVYALKATGVVAAHHEYRVLRDLREDHLPVVEPVGVVSDAPNPGDGVLITRYLDFSLPYWYLLGRDDQALADRLMDAGVVLLVRLHLEGVYWGDCSLSNILWRRDAGAMMAYLVDAETTERHATIGDRMRANDVDIAVENVIGGLMELQASGRIVYEIDHLGIAEIAADPIRGAVG